MLVLLRKLSKVGWVLFSISCIENTIQQGEKPVVGHDSRLDSQNFDTAPPDSDDLDQCAGVEAAAAGSVPISDACDGGTLTPVSDPWRARTFWEFHNPEHDPDSYSADITPIVGNLTDDNGDGQIDSLDSPEVVIVVVGVMNTLVVIDGATGVEEWEQTDVNNCGGNVIADVDSDGVPELVVTTTNGRVRAFTGDGVVKWTSADAAISQFSTLMTVADLDADGFPEIVVDDLVLNGEDGSTAFRLDLLYENWYHETVVADIDLDGKQELFTSGTAYNSDGSILWTTDMHGAYGFWPAIVQADSDPEGEVVFIGSLYSLWDTDGTLLAQEDRGSAQPGMPCAADYDGDGMMEIAWPSYDTMWMIELDGTVNWTIPISDSSGASGCSSWDVNSDGLPEILWAGETIFEIIDGATGNIRWSDPDQRSRTEFEYPSVADLDGDGHAEILYSSHGGLWGALKVITHDGAGWASAGPNWPTVEYSVTNINSDGDVPALPSPAWLSYKVFHGRPADTLIAPDLVVSINDVCILSCSENLVNVAVQVANQGGAMVPAGATLRLYAVGDPNHVIAETKLPQIAPGELLEGEVFELLLDDLSTGFRAVVDAGGGVDECDESNNEAINDTEVCP